MVMSQDSSTFLACFSGFWLVWAVVVTLCCFCTFLQRRLKRRHDDCRLPSADRPSPLLTPPPPPLQLRPSPRPHTVSPSLPLQVLHPLPQATWVSVPDADVIGTPPCYEEAVLMEDPPPPYSEVLTDPRGGAYLKPEVPPPLRESQDHVFTSKTMKFFPERGYSSLIGRPWSQHWDSVGHLLSNVDLNHAHLITPTSVAVATMPRPQLRTQHDAQGLRGPAKGGIQGFPGGFQSTCGPRTDVQTLGRSTAV